VFRTPKDVKCFAQAVVRQAEFEDEKHAASHASALFAHGAKKDESIIDLSVYDEGRCFRTYGAVKMSKDGVSAKNPLLTGAELELERETRVRPPLSGETLVRTLLQAVVLDEQELRGFPSVLRGTVRVVKRVWACGFVERARPRDEASAKRVRASEPSAGPAPANSAAESAFHKFLATNPLMKALGGDNKIQFKYVKPNERGEMMGCVRISTDDRVKCEARGAAHNSNGSFFHLNLTTGCGYFVCLDAECRSMATRQPGSGVWGRGRYL